MAFSYPLSLPASPKLFNFDMRPRRAMSSHESPFNLTEEVQLFSGRRWELSFTLPPVVDRATAELWITTILKLDGGEGTILIGDPDATEQLGDLSGSVPVVKGAGQTGKELLVEGLAITKTGVWLPGDYFQLGSGEQTRMYKILSQVDSDSNGEATLDIWPNLREPTTDGELLVTESPKATFRLFGGIMPWGTDALKTYSFNYEFMEAI